MYLDVDKGDVKLNIRVDNSGLRARQAPPNRQWRILITQLTHKQAGRLNDTGHDP